jgi:hypothetical protein
MRNRTIKTAKRVWRTWSLPVEHCVTQEISDEALEALEQGLEDKARMLVAKNLVKFVKPEKVVLCH